ncbi:MAG: hypothetical protein HYV07_12835 [Deltaproteobacteria bacterium]|nr:hypothetical protein [Deltaproteobacteria bacterium]
MITTRNGIYQPALSKAKDYDKSGNTISKAETKQLVTMMKNALINEYEGATSSKGLAGDRNVLARTARAIVKNSDHGKWALTDAARAELKEAFGTKLDGKTGSIADLVKQIRNDVKANSTGYTYWG